MKFLPACVATAGLFLLGPLASATDNYPPPPVQPTVTVRSGDTGGTIFGEKPDPKKTRRYYIAAEPTPWDFVPSGRDLVCGLTLPPAVKANRESPKLRYIQYTDETFTARVLPNASLGMLGPVLRGVVGEFLVITFLNRTTQPVSMHPHGVRYDKHSEGAYYRPNPGRGAAVEPGAKFTYVWQLDESSGPLPSEPSSKGWLYHSHVLGDSETNLGLIGTIIVTDPKRARPDGTPDDVDREFATLFMIFDESGDSPAPPTTTSAATTTPPVPPEPTSWARSQELAEEGQRPSINGYLYGNLRGLEMNEGERTRWYLYSLGSEKDFHTAHWHGLRVIEEGRRRTDVVELLPATMKTADVIADNPGSWLYHCHVADHMREGMFARFTVYERGTVGVSRAPETAFLGLPAATRSIRIDRSDALLNLVVMPARADVIIEGVIAAPEPFSVLKSSVRVQFAGKETVFQLNEQGLGKEPRAMLRISNTEETSLVRGGQLDFQLTFSGADWLDNVRPPGAAGMGASAPPLSVPLVIDIGSARHTAVLSIVSRVQEPDLKHGSERK